MDFFYKPPLQRFDECKTLEDNYMNCLLQKAFRDNVTSNRCNLDSVLWFHLECPRSVSQFDDPLQFKRKVRDFLDDQRVALDAINKDKEANDRVHNSYGHILYPEDVKEAKQFKEF